MDLYFADAASQRCHLDLPPRAAIQGDEEALFAVDTDLS